MGRLVFDNLKKVTLYLMPVSRLCGSSTISAGLILMVLQAGSYSEFMAVLANVLLGMQLPMNSYQQVCYCITNDVIMSISLMYEQPEWGGRSLIHERSSAHILL
jgi:sodium/potassium-transporting ATPase subunit alpha